jgi:hypothetical protein
LVLGQAAWTAWPKIGPYQSEASSATRTAEAIAAGASAIGGSAAAIRLKRDFLPAEYRYQDHWFAQWVLHSSPPFLFVFELMITLISDGKTWWSRRSLLAMWQPIRLP